MPRKKVTFEEFWKRYPLHEAKKSAERAWNRLSANNQLAAYNGIDRYKEHCRQTGMAFKYAQGWLNDHRWTDEYTKEEPDYNLEETPSEPLPTGMEIW